MSLDQVNVTVAAVTGLQSRLAFPTIGHAEKANSAAAVESTRGHTPRRRENAKAVLVFGERRQATFAVVAIDVEPDATDRHPHTDLEAANGAIADAALDPGRPSINMLRRRIDTVTPEQAPEPGNLSAVLAFGRDATKGEGVVAVPHQNISGSAELVSTQASTIAGYRCTTVAG
ncbi:hypothetical protein [Mycobacterium sp. 3519A]|uniref:hypothetical protein n=1 Tax=Mycobacterium sp. 3519A TaxID=2057184 RepID=UPI0035187F06